MVSGFWATLKKPILASAPMANVTDAAFRRILAKYGKPDVIWTEFVSCDGLCSTGREKLLIDLWFTPAEKPVVVQFFGAKPEMFYQCALLAQKLGFDGIDINMGCPDKGVEKQGAGAALMNNPELAKKIVFETKRGAGDLPVSIKTRIGYSTNNLDSWLPHLLETEPAAIILHLRTRKEMSRVKAHWETATEAMKIARKYDSSSQRTLIIGNGDCDNVAEALSRAQQYNLDGIMIGRGAFGNPWLFDQSKAKVTTKEKLEVMVEHARLFSSLYKIDPETGFGLKEFSVMKKHFKSYTSGFAGAKELRQLLMRTKHAKEVAEVANRWLARNI
jgi:nifR3 family TIM-barrel protein